MDATTSLQIKGAIFTAILPAFSVIVFALVGHFTGGRGSRARRWPLAAGIALGMAGSYFGITGGLPDWPITDGGAWLPFLLLGIFGLFAALDRGEESQGIARVMPAIAIGLGAIIYLTLATSIEQTWTTASDLLLHVGAPAGLALLLWLGVDRAQVRAASPAIFAAICVASIGAAVTALLGSSAKLAQLLGALAAASGMAALISWRWPHLKAGHSGVAVLLTGYIGVLVYAHHYAYPGLPVTSMILLSTAPLAAAVATLVPKTLPAVAVTSLVALAPAASAAWITKSQADAAAAADEAEGKSKFGEGYVEPTY
ncbi:MAG: hypothetical protein ACE366_02910 [Bradymonadia bacterium]